MNATEILIGRIGGFPEIAGRNAMIKELQGGNPEGAALLFIEEMVSDARILSLIS